MSIGGNEVISTEVMLKSLGVLLAVAVVCGLSSRFFTKNPKQRKRKR